MVHGSFLLFIPTHGTRLTLKYSNKRSTQSVVVSFCTPLEPSDSKIWLITWSDSFSRFILVH